MSNKPTKVTVTSKLTDAAKAKLRERIIKESNKRFDSMTPAERRVAVARDVLKQLNKKKIVASNQGDYVHVNGRVPTSVVDDTNTLVTEVFAGTTCKCCARGAMFVSACSLFNAPKLSELRLDEKIKDLNGRDLRLQENQLFTRRQIDMIETAFEGWPIYNSAEKLPADFRNAAEQFYRANPSATKRMRMIMLSIIRNKGEFVMPREYYRKAAQTA